MIARWLGNVRISNKLALVVVLPILGLIYFSADGIWSRYRQVEEMQSVGTMVRFAPYVSTVIHEMQRERGLSAGFIGSKGKTLSLIHI